MSSPIFDERRDRVVGEVQALRGELRQLHGLDQARAIKQRVEEIRGTVASGDEDLLAVVDELLAEVHHDVTAKFGATWDAPETIEEARERIGQLGDPEANPSAPLDDEELEAADKAAEAVMAGEAQPVGTARSLGAQVRRLVSEVRRLRKVEAELRGHIGDLGRILEQGPE